MFSILTGMVLERGGDGGLLFGAPGLFRRCFDRGTLPAHKIGIAAFDKGRTSAFDAVFVHT